MTILSVLWARVELQAIRYTPYFRLYQTAGHDGVPVDGVDLDYTKLLPPMVLLESLKRRHLLVFFATIGSLLLKAQVVLSSGFFLTTSVQRSIPVEVDILDSFVTNMDSFVADGAAYSVTSAVQDHGMQVPLGVDSDGAYQTFKMQSPWEHDNVKSFRGTVDAQLEVPVDHVSVDTECLPLQSFDVFDPENLPFEADFGAWYKKIQVRLQFEACDEEITVSMGNIITAQGPFLKNKATHWLVASGGQGIEDSSQSASETGVIKGINLTRACPSLSQQGPMILYMLGLWGPSSEDESMPNLDTCSATLCYASAGISKATVVDNGIRPAVTVQPGEKEAISLDYKIWKALLRYPEVAFFQKIGAIPFLEGPIWRLAEVRGETQEQDVLPFTSDDLVQSVYNMTEPARAMIGHLKFRQAFDVPETRTAAIHTQLSRLQVSQGVAVSMAVLSSLCLGIAVCLMMVSRKTLRAWHRDPASILGLMSLFAEPSEIREAVEGVSSTARAENEGKWQQGSFSPMVLRGWIRALFTGYVIALIIALAVTLRISKSSQGLVTVGDEGHSPLWKLIPSMVLFVVTQYITSVDKAIRALSELLILSSKVNFTIQDHDRSLLDMLGLRAWYYSIRLKVPAVTASQSMALIASILVTLTSSLFDSRLVPQSSMESLPTESWFGSRAPPGANDPPDSKTAYWGNFHDTRNLVSGLLLIRDTDEFTSPRNTFHDLLFPSFDSSVAATSPNLRRASSVEITAPAARLDGQCTRFEEGRDFHVEIGSQESYLHLDGFNCNNQGIIIHQTSTTENLMSNYIATEVNYKDENECKNLDSDMEEFTLWNKPWVATTYAWGETSLDSGKLEILHLSVWRCNYSWAEVSSDLKFIASDGELLLEHASSPDGSETPRPWEPPFNPPSLKTAFTTVSSGLARIASSFMLVVGDQGPLKPHDLGDPNREEDVLRRLKSNMAFAAAQLANIESRLSLSEKSGLPPETPGELPPIEAAFIRERQRLVQDPNVTYALVAILSFIAAVNLWAVASSVLRRFLSDPEQSPPWWLLDLELKGQAPPGFSSISMMETLLHGSNYASYMPENASKMSSKELYRYLGGTRFRMGWFRDDTGGNSKFTIGVVPDTQDPAGVMLNRESSEK